MMLEKLEVMVKTRENKGEKPKHSNSHHPISANIGNISITSWSSFHTYYISFQSLGSQESIGSNGARFGVETKKLWPFERIQFRIWAGEQCLVRNFRTTPSLVRNFHTTLSLCEFFSFFIPTLPNLKPLSLVLSCSKWGPLIIFVNI